MRRSASGASLGGGPGSRDTHQLCWCAVRVHRVCVSFSLSIYTCVKSRSHVSPDSSACTAALRTAFCVFLYFRTVLSGEGCLCLCAGDTLGKSPSPSCETGLTTKLSALETKRRRKRSVCQIRVDLVVRACARGACAENARYRGGCDITRVAARSATHHHHKQTPVTHSQEVSIPYSLGALWAAPSLPQ